MIIFREEQINNKGYSKESKVRLVMIFLKLVNFTIVYKHSGSNDQIGNNLQELKEI